MSGEFSNPPVLTWNKLLAAAEAGELDNMPLPDVRESPYDTTFLAPEEPEMAPPPPPGVNDVREAYAQGFSGWENGSVVRGTFSLGVERSRFGRVRAFTELVDTKSPYASLRQIASFNLGSVANFSEAELNRIALLGARRVIADLYVTPGSSLSAGSEHGAFVSQILAVERAFNGNTEGLRRGEPLIIHGEVEEYLPGLPHAMGTEGAGFIKLIQPDDSVITVNSGAYAELMFGGGNYVAGEAGHKELTPPYALPGDRVQVAAQFVSLLWLPDVPGQIQIRSPNSMHLLDPSVTRLRLSLDSSAQIDEVLRRVGSYEALDLKRSVIGNYVAGLLRFENNTVVSDLTGQNREKLIRSLGFERPYSAEASAERPMALALSDKDSLYHLVKAFGKGVLSMSPAEFAGFALQVARGEHPTTNIKAGEVIDRHLTSNQKAYRVAYVLARLTDFYDRYLEARETTPTSPPRDQYTALMLAKVIRSDLRGIGETSLAPPLIKLTLDAFSKDSPLKALRQSAAQALTNSLMRCGVWEDDFIARQPLLLSEFTPPAEFVQYRPAYAAYVAAMPQIRAAIAQANEQGSTVLISGEVWEPYRELLDRLDLVASKLPPLPEAEEGPDDSN